MGLGHKFKNIRYGPSPINFYTVLTMAYKTCSTADLLYNQYNMRERYILKKKWADPVYELNHSMKTFRGNID